MDAADRSAIRELWRQLEVRRRRDRLFSFSTLSTAELREASSSTRTVASAQPIDLYCWWAICTGFRTTRPSKGAYPTRLPFIAEGDIEKFHRQRASHPQLNVTLPAEYQHPPALGENQADKRLSSYFTFEILIPRKPAPQTRENDARGSAAHPSNTYAEIDWSQFVANLRTIYTDLFLERVQMGAPVGLAQVDASLNTGSLEPFVPAEPPPSEPNCADVVIGVIDDGAAFAHESLRAPAANGLASRVKVVWNQSTRLRALARDCARWQHPVPDWASPAGDGWYGAMMGEKQINQTLVEFSQHGEVDELACYRSLLNADEMRRTLHMREAHGAAVMTALAGATSARNVIADQPGSLLSLRPREMDDDASKAPIIFVDLPFELKSVSSGRWMPIAALDGIRFILRQARARYQTKEKQKVPVVINLSSGANSGSHDGSSMFESALAELLAADQFLAVTLAAGNSRLANAHHEITIKPGDVGEVAVRVPPDKPSETYVEVWPEWADSGGTFSLEDIAKVSFSITSPDGRMRGGIKAGDGEEIFKDEDENPLAGVKFALNAVQAKNRPMLLLVVAPTFAHEWRPRPPYGNWVLRCTNGTNRPLRLQSWIERDEIVFGIRRPQLAHFVHSGEGPYRVDAWDDKTGYSVSRYNTTSNLSNAADAFAVAAGVGGRLTGYVSPYSGGGSSVASVQQPYLIARADRSPASPGMPVYGSYRSVRFHMNGTSIAAPHAARWIANSFARGKDRAHIACLAMYSTPRAHRHLGQVPAAGEGRIFIEDTDSAPEQCLGPFR